MATFNLELSPELMEMMKELEDPSSLCEKGMKEAEKIMVEAMKEECEKHKRSNRDPTRGEMAESIKATGPRKNEYGLYDFVRPTGKDSKGVRNMEKLAYLQYGTVQQAAEPVCEPVVTRIESQVLQELQRPFEGVVKNHGS